MKRPVASAVDNATIKQRTEMFIFWARDLAQGANACEVLGSVPSTAKNKGKSFLSSQDVILMCIFTQEA